MIVSGIRAMSEPQSWLPTLRDEQGFEYVLGGSVAAQPSNSSVASALVAVS